MRKFAVIDERHKTCSFFSEQECNFLLPEPQGIVRLIPIDIVVEIMWSPMMQWLICAQSSVIVVEFCREYL